MTRVASQRHKKNNFYAQLSPQQSTVRGSAAQTVDGILRVPAPGFRSSASPLMGATPSAHSIIYGL